MDVHTIRVLRLSGVVWVDVDVSRRESGGRIVVLCGGMHVV